MYGYEERRERLEEYLRGASEEVQLMGPGFRSLRWGPEEVNAYLATARRSGSATLGMTAGCELIGELEEAKMLLGCGVDYASMRKLGNHVTTLREELTEDQKQLMRADLVGITAVEFSQEGNGDRVKHSVPHAYRSVMLIQVFRFVPRGARVLEVGACPKSAVQRGALLGKYYGLVPALDIRDVERYNQKMRAISVMSRRRGRNTPKPAQLEAAEAVMKDPSVMFSRQKLQDVVGSFDYIVSIQSNWDIPIVEVPRACHRLGATAYVLVMDRVPGLGFFKGVREGEVSALGLKWVADADADEITFYFDRDTSCPYKHKLSIVRDYQELAGRSFTCGGRLYAFREAPFSTNLQLALICFDLGMRTLPQEEGYICRPTGLAGRIRVTCPVKEPTVRAGESPKFRTGSFEVSEDMLCRVLQDRMLKGASGSPDTVLQFARQNRLSVLHNGVRVSVENPITVENFRMFAVAVDALASDMLASSERDAAIVVKSFATGGRVFRGPLDTAFSAVVEGATGAGSLYEAVERRVRQLVSDRVAGAITLERLSGVSKTARLPTIDVTCESSGSANIRVRSCYCYERQELAAMLSGDCGGISDLELEALRRYQSVLQSRVCSACAVHIDHAELEIRLAEEAEEFFDCESGETTEVDSVFSTPALSRTSSESDSGYESAEMTDTALPLSLEAELDICTRMEKFVGSSHTGDRQENTEARQAVMEFAQILRDQMSAADSHTRNTLVVAGMGGKITQDVLDVHCNEREWYSLVRVDPGGLLVKAERKGVSLDGFQRVYDFQQGKFYNVTRLYGRYRVPVECSSCVYTSFKYKLWNQPRMLAKVMDVLSGEVLDGPEPRFPFVNGVPGCGKTQGVMEAYKENVKVPGQRLILSATRSSVEKIREELFGNSRDSFEIVRSYDSLLMWGIPRWYPEVVFDEMAALHPGKLLAVYAILQPRLLRGYGDFKQMEFKPFLGKLRPVYELKKFCDSEYLAHSHRLRISVLAACLGWYGEEVPLSLCGCCEHSLESEEGGPEMQEMRGLSELPVEKPGTVQYLTYTQEEKERVRSFLRDFGYSRQAAEEACCTIAESQGITREVVYVVRLTERMKPDSIYFEDDRVNVGRTRSELKVKYFTVSKEKDLMVRSCQEALSEVLRQKVRNNTEAFLEKVREAGGMSAYLRSFFELRPVRFVDVE